MMKSPFPGLVLGLQVHLFMQRPEDSDLVGEKAVECHDSDQRYLIVVGLESKCSKIQGLAVSAFPYSSYAPQKTQ